MQTRKQILDQMQEKYETANIPIPDYARGRVELAQECVDGALNLVKGAVEVGLLETDDEGKLRVPESAFMPGHAPQSKTTHPSSSSETSAGEEHASPVPHAKLKSFGQSLHRHARVGAKVAQDPLAEETKAANQRAERKVGQIDKRMQRSDGYIREIFEDDKSLFAARPLEAAPPSSSLQSYASTAGHMIPPTYPPGTSARAYPQQGGLPSYPADPFDPLSFGSPY